MTRVPKLSSLVRQAKEIVLLGLISQFLDSRSPSPYGDKRKMRRNISYSRSPQRRRPSPRSRSPRSRKPREGHYRPRQRHSTLTSPHPQDSPRNSDRGNPRRRSPSSSPPHRKHSDSRSPRNHKRSRRRPTLSPSPPPPKTKRSNQPLPSQNDAYKGTSTALDNPSSTTPAPLPSKQKPNYAPSGLLAAETNTVANTSIVLKYHEPPESRLPPSSQPYLLYIFKSSALLSKLTLNERSCWLFGREKMVADVPVEHPSASKQHAVLQFRHVVKKDEFGEKRGGVGLYMLDLDSANGSFLNGERVDALRYVEVRHGDVLKWGESSREYVVLVPPKEMVAK
ncbi:MAG: hypothetical protein LQ337_007664 [Flavoplaca oasis]|nr:MAG: hypothetical protein LQ337_007664 [Flavoplaca oasis]